MADDDLKIGIGADTDPLKKGLADAGKQVDEFNKKVGGTFSKKNTVEAKKTEKSIEDLGDAFEGTEEKIDGLLGAGEAATDMLDGQVPAMSNVKSAASALSGIGGIAGLAASVGALYAAGMVLLAYYGQQRRDLLDAKIQYKLLNDRISEYEKSLWGLQKVRLAGTQAAAAEVTHLRTLRAQIEDVNMSTEDRKQSIADLRKLQPEYLKGISDEDLLMGNLPEVYDKATASILRQARAKAALDALTKNQMKAYTLEAQLAENSAEIQVQANKKIALSAQEKYITQAYGAEVYNSKMKGIQDRIDDGLENQGEIVKDINSLSEEALKIAKDINDNGGILGDPDNKKIKETVEKIEKVRGSLAGIFRSLESFTSVSPFADDGPSVPQGYGDVDLQRDVPELSYEEKVANIERYRSYLDEASPAIRQQIMDMVPDPEVFGGLLEQNVNKLFEATDKQKEILTNFNEAVTDLVNNALFATFNSLGQMIGDALGGGEDAAKNGAVQILSIIGNLLGTFGQLVIAAGIAAVGLELAIKNWFEGGGWVAIAAGVALVAAGAAVSNFAGNLGSQNAKAGGSKGGSVSGASGTGSSGGSAASSQRSTSTGSGGGTYVFEIAGTKLIGVLKNTIDRNQALGGSNLTFG